MKLSGMVMEWPLATWMCSSSDRVCGDPTVFETNLLNVDISVCGDF